MSDQFWQAFFVNLPLSLIALGTLLTSVGGLVVAIHTSRKMETVKREINGRMTELIDVTAKSSKAEGVKQEFDRDKGV